MMPRDVRAIHVVARCPDHDAERTRKRSENLFHACGDSAEAAHGVAGRSFFFAEKRTIVQKSRMRWMIAK
jgi:hypothetical protein